jgi:hypothetical protein
MAARDTAFGVDGAPGTRRARRAARARGASGSTANRAKVRVGTSGRLSLVGYVRSRAFPRDRAVTPDGGRVLVSNYDSSELETLEVPGNGRRMVGPPRRTDFPHTRWLSYRTLLSATAPERDGPALTPALWTLFNFDGELAINGPQPLAVSRQILLVATTLGTMERKKSRVRRGHCYSARVRWAGGQTFEHAPARRAGRSWSTSSLWA